ncbi:MAG: hypothetical protein ACOYJ2_03030 [Rickettsiales bacterium]
MAATTKVAPSLQIGEYEPLVWLVAMLFTQKFWDREGLTWRGATLGVLLNLQANVDTEESQPEYSSVGEIYQDAEDFVASDEKAKACMDAVLEDIRLGELSYYSPRADKWGEKPAYHHEERDIDSFTFLKWADENGYPISEEVFAASKTIISMARYKREAAEREEYAFPSITRQDFEQERKVPLWELGAGILYLIGRRSRAKGEESEFTGSNRLFEEMAAYAADAKLAGDLTLIGENEDFLQLKVKPEILIKWATNLPVILPMLHGSPVSTVKPEYCTPDMALMYDAITKFWGDYDLANPNPSIAPMKKDVVAWLVQEAARRGISDFSESRAKVLDTIIRCPKARLGGNTF